jgi:hypothetical protein
MALTGASETIHAAVTQWPGIEAKPHQFGGIEYRLTDAKSATRTEITESIFLFRVRCAMNW